MGLTIVGLPLGNIKDISLRAIETLDKATVVICEDTRVFGKLWAKLMQMELLNHKFEGKLEVVNDFNEGDKAKTMAQKIVDYGEEVLLVSDAGMPVFSDPGYKLVKELRELNQEVKVIPGPTAASTALVMSGLPSDRVLFLGFLPKKQIKRTEIWAGIKKLGFGVTLAIYEAPGRTDETIAELRCEFEGAEIVVTREISKEYEEVIENPEAEREYRGEVVILVRVA